MREKKRCRWLALLLAVVMLLSVLPTAVFAVGDTSNDEFYKIVHVDCGRKYFSPENIKKIIDNAAAAGFNQVELYLSDNQGFRFALDDMNVTTSTGNTYNLAPALGDGYSDGSKYPDGSGKYLTQSEMTDIISYATGKGIDIVPCVNVPGHMGAILQVFTQFKYSGSNSSIDLENTEAVAFALAITEKYATYFESQGVKFYNLGADEYANDLSTMGFQGLYTSGKYQKFVDFLNNAAQIIINHKMTPRAFNDGIYYNEDNTYSINSAIQVCYWSCGWSGYNLASAQYLVNQDMDVINTHGDYYWVLGNTSWQCSANKASQFDYTSFQYRTGTTGNGTISNPAGAMFCIWCDVGNADGTDGGTAVVSATADVIAAFGAVLPASETGGETGGGSGDTGDVEVTENKTITLNVGGTSEIFVQSDHVGTEGNYTTSDGIASYTITHVSNTTDASVETTRVDTPAGEFIIGNKSNNQWLVLSGSSISTTNDPTKATKWTIASKDGVYTIKSGEYYLGWTAKSSSIAGLYTEYTYTLAATTSSADKFGNNYVWNYDTNGFNVTLTSSEGRWSGTNTSFYYLRYNSNAWKMLTGTSNSGSAYSLTEIPGTTTNTTTIVFTGVSLGTTEVTLGNTRYTIKVVAEDLSGVTPLTVEYWITNLPVTADGATSKKISAQSAYGEAGVDVSTLVPATGTYEYGSVVYWKGTVLDSSNKQTTAGGSVNDKTGSGKDFNLIRYYNGSWQYFYEAGGTWNTISSTDQVVIYWLQPTEVTKEITTLVKDWGFAPDAQGDNEKKVALTVAVVYPDGTVSPAEGDMYSTSTTLFNYWQGRDIGLVAPVNNSDYEIAKITVTDGTRDQSGTGKWGINDTITWEKVTNEAGQQWYNETTYWDETVGGTPMVNGATSSITWSNYNTAKLVLIYLKPIHYDTNLIVNWVDDSDSGALISTMEVAVSSDGTPITFYNGLKQTSALPTEGVGGTFTLDDNAYVTNSSNVNQTFNKNISTVPDVADRYKTGLYQYVSADLSADGKTLTLHYNVKADKTFVYDFGLPMQVKLKELLDNTSDVYNISFDSSEVKYENNVVTFTPSSAAVSTITTKATITFVDATTQTMTIAFVPASNVLYEENFMNSVEDNYVDWTYTANSITAFTYDAGTVYGYNSAYDNCTGANGQYTASVNAENNSTDDLKFTFMGTGFDLIAQCGAATGTLMVRVDNVNGEYVKSYLVDTSFNDSNVSDNLFQVPVIHEQNLKNGTYTVTIFGAYIDYNPASNSNASPASTFSMRSVGSSAIDTIYELADRMGLSGDDLDSMEFINVDQLYGASTYAMRSTSTMATTAIAGPTALSTPAPTELTVYIDAFRVYRPDNQLYKETEQGVEYVNVLDAVNDATFAAYVEGNSNGTDYTVTNYEGRGGPQNEIYLAKDQAIAFKVTGSVQVSLRSVNGTEISAYINGTTYQQLQHTTEMYYAVTAQDGLVTIKNTSDSLLAICNFKFAAGSSSASLTEEDYPVVYSMLRMTPASVPEPDPEQPGTEEPEPTPVFTPETFKTRVNSIRTRNRKIVTLTITASTDVDHVVVNGKTYYPMNKLLVKWGLSKTYVFTIMDTAGASETRSFEIVAYNADGLASIIYTDAG